MTTSKIQMDQIRSTSATVTGENIRAGSQKKSSLSPAEGLQGASPDATCTCPSGDGSLVHPCPAHPASVKQTGGDERTADEKPRATRCPDCGESDLMPGDLCACGYETDPAAGCACPECDGSGDGYVGEVCRECDGSGWFVTPEQARAALAQPSPVRSSLLINGYQLRAALEFIAPDGTAKQLESEARIEWRQQDADFLEAGLYAWCAEYPEEGCVLLDEEPATAQPSPAQAEQAEAERPDVVAVVRAQGFGRVCEADANAIYQHCSDGETLMTVAQHERIAASRWERAMDLMGEHVARISDKLTAERDAALARVASLESKLAELEKQEPAGAPMPDEIHQMAFEEGQPAEDGDGYIFSAEEFDLFVQRLLDSCAAPVAQAQPEETPGEILAAKLIETWVTKHGKPAPWSTAIEITAVATNMPNDERDRLLALDDDMDAQAQHCVPDDVETFLDEVRAELLRARSKFPGDRIMTIALAEEFGELCKAVLDEPAANVRKEAVQTAVMAARVVLDGDGSVTAWRAERGLDPLAAAPGKEEV
ncbi:TPA: hypothetical protein ACLF0Q_000690 [Pseudomonas aeruginosa]